MSLMDFWILLPDHVILLIFKYLKAEVISKLNCYGSSSFMVLFIRNYSLVGVWVAHGIESVETSYYGNRFSNKIGTSIQN